MLAMLRQVLTQHTDWLCCDTSYLFFTDGCLGKPAARDKRAQHMAAVRTYKCSKTAAAQHASV